MFTNNFYVFSMLLQQDHVGMYKVSNANLQHRIIIIMIIIKWKSIFLLKNFSLRESSNLWIYVQLINIRIGMLSKCSNVNRVLLPFLVSLHHH